MTSRAPQGKRELVDGPRTCSSRALPPFRRRHAAVVTQYATHGLRKLGPLGTEGGQALLSALGNRVVTPSALALLISPLASHQTCIAEPVQEGINSALARQQAIGVSEFSDQ